MAGLKSGTGAGTSVATGTVERVEIVTRGEVRRSYTPEEQVQVLTEAAAPGARMLLVAQRYGVPPSLVYRGRREAAGRPVRMARPPGFVRLLVEHVGPSGASAAQAEPPRQGGFAGCVEVVLRNGRVLRVGPVADLAAARLAAVLEA